MRVSRTASKWVASISLRSRTPSMQDAKNGASLSALNTASRDAATVILPSIFNATSFHGVTRHLGADRAQVTVAEPITQAKFRNLPFYESAIPIIALPD